MFVINDKCISCGLCAGNCPVNCINEGEAHLVIDQDACVQCGTCQMNCPVDAIDREG